MGIKDYIKSKRNNHKIDVVTALENAIDALEAHIDGLKDGTVHSNVNTLTDPEQKRFAQQMIENEKFHAIHGLHNLKHTRSVISSHQIIDTFENEQITKNK